MWKFARHYSIFSIKIFYNHTYVIDYIVIELKYDFEIM